MKYKKKSDMYKKWNSKNDMYGLDDTHSTVYTHSRTVTVQRNVKITAYYVENAKGKIGTFHELE